MVVIAGSFFKPDGHLQAVCLNAVDDQLLFQLSVRLRFGEDPRVIIPALLQLSGSVVLDFPPEVFIQQIPIMVIF